MDPESCTNGDVVTHERPPEVVLVLSKLVQENEILRSYSGKEHGFHRRGEYRSFERLL